MLIKYRDDLCFECKKVSYNPHCFTEILYEKMKKFQEGEKLKGEILKC